MALNNLRDRNHRFAYDLVNKVMEIRGDSWPYNLLVISPVKSVFTKEHADVIRDYLVNRSAADEMDAYLRDATVFDINHLRHLMDCIKRRYECNGFANSQRGWDRDYSCIYACAKIAYTACYFRRRHCVSATIEAIDFIYNWVSQRPSRFFHARHSPHPLN